MKVQVLKKTEAGPGVCILALGAPDGRPLPPFAAGSRIDVQLAGAVLPAYALPVVPGEPGRCALAVALASSAPGGADGTSLAASHAKNGSLQSGEAGTVPVPRAGDMLALGAPREPFAQRPEAGHAVLFAAGLGIVPILAMAEGLARSGASFELHCDARSPLGDTLRARLQDERLAPHCHVYASEADGAGRPALGAPAPGRHAYVCGPGAFIDAVLAAGRAAGWAEGNLHREYADQATPPAEAAGAEDGPFQVRIASTGQVIEVGAQQSITDALDEAGVQVLVSCEQGVCGTCLVNVLEGVPDHRDQYLTEDERAANDQMLPCCSRAKTPLLVLDL